MICVTTLRPSTTNLFVPMELASGGQMQKQHVIVGEQFGHLTVIGPADSDARGNQLVTVKCDCPAETTKVVRLCNLRFQPYQDRAGKWRFPTRSCGCQSILAYLDFLDRRASGFSKRFRHKVWKEYQKGRTFKQLATIFHLESDLISALCRMHDREQRMKRPRNRRDNNWGDFADEGDFPF